MDELLEALEVSMSMGTVRPLCPPYLWTSCMQRWRYVSPRRGGQASLPPAPVEVGPWLSVRPLTPVDKLHAALEVSK